jgi:dipeptidyl aminopeptidase/acylaminoacyl peptidase
MKTILATCIALLAFVVSVPAQQSAAVRRFTFDDFSKVKRVSDPQFSPDGSTIAVIVSEPNLDEDRHMASVAVVDIATGKLTTLVDGAKAISVSFERWAPSGQQIAYLANVPTNGAAKPQVFVVSSKGGASKQITTAPSGVQQLAWSPDSKTIAFATADEPEKKTGYQRWNDSFEVQMNDNFLTTATLPPTHVWMVSAAGGEMKRLTSGAWTLPVSRPPGAPSSMITFTPDGSSIVFARNGGGGAAGGGAGLQSVNIATGTVTAIGTAGSFPTFSAKGDMVATQGGSFYPVTANGMVVAPAGATPAAAPPATPPAAVGAAGAGGRGDAGAGRGNGGGNANGGGRGRGASITQGLDRGIQRTLWAADGKSLILGGNDSERVSLWQAPLDPADGPLKKIDTGDVSPNSSFFVDMSVSAKTGAIAFSGTSPTRPGELYYMAAPGAPVKRLTSVNDEIASIPLGKSEVITFKNDDFEQNAILTYPPDFNPSKKYPLVLLIHGGPAAASLMTFSAGAQLMAAKGWLVLQPNYRGSDNLGQRFRGAISGDAGAGPGRDVIAAIHTVKAKGIVDETKLGVGGWSYGGYMTTWMLGNYPDMWKAGVAGAAVTDQIDQQNLSDGAGRQGGQPYVNPDAMKRVQEQSPISYASKIKAPTLILANTGDYRVPITNSYKLFHTIASAGTTVKFFAYPIYGHNATDPVRQRDVQERWVGWLEKYLNEPAAPGGGR